MKNTIHNIIQISLALITLGLIYLFYCTTTIALNQKLFNSNKPQVCYSNELHCKNLQKNANFNTISCNFSAFCYKTCQNMSKCNNQTTHTVDANNSYSIEHQSHTFSISASEPQYAKAKENCILFRTANTSNLQQENIYFQIPESYFVRILEIEPDSQTYKVIYGNTIGHIDFQSARRVNIVPENPFVESFLIQTKSDSGTQLREYPSTSTNAVALIPPGSTITYVASTAGTKPTDGFSNEWYYVQYFPPSEPTTYYEGYVYSERIESQISILQNQEDDPIEPLQLIEDNYLDAVQSKQTPAYIKGILITVLCLPSVLFAIYIGSKILAKKRSFDSI